MKFPWILKIDSPWPMGRQNFSFCRFDEFSAFIIFGLVNISPGLRIYYSLEMLLWRVGWSLYGTWLEWYVDSWITAMVLDWDHLVFDPWLVTLCFVQSRYDLSYSPISLHLVRHWWHPNGPGSRDYWLLPSVCVSLSTCMYYLVDVALAVVDSNDHQLVF